MPRRTCWRGRRSATLRDLVLTTTLQPCLQCSAAFEKALRALREGPMTGLVHELEDLGETEHLAAMEVNEALGYLWPQLQKLTKAMPAS
jgi:hypothetical protein